MNNIDHNKRECILVFVYILSLIMIILLVKQNDVYMYVRRMKPSDKSQEQAYIFFNFI